jgi:transposase-like protein
MDPLRCKRCESARCVRHGVVRGMQRYWCKECNYRFTPTPPRGKPVAMKALALLLYGMGNMSYGMIAKLLGVSSVAVYKWVRHEAARLPEPRVPADVRELELDEMWHFVNGKKTSGGSGKPMLLLSGEAWPGQWVGVMMKPAASSSPKRASKASSS